LLFTDPARAEALLQPLVQAEPGPTGPGLMLSVALQRQGKFEASRQLLEPMVAATPGWAVARYYLGVTLAALGRHAEAHAQLVEAHKLEPQLAGLARALGHAAFALGDRAAAEGWYRAYLQDPIPESWINEARASFHRNDLRDAEAVLRAQLATDPADPLALMLLADVALACKHPPTAGECFDAVLARVPSWPPARAGRAMVLLETGQRVQGMTNLEAILASAPGYYPALRLKAAELAREGRFEQALACFEQIIARNPEDVESGLHRGAMLQTLGRHDEAAAAFQHCTEIRGTYGEAWWALANLKRYEFSVGETMRMEAALATPQLGDVDRIHLDFALGTARASAGDAAAALRHFSRGNALRRKGLPDEAPAYAAYVQRCRAQHTSQYFAARKDCGNDAPDPIFIIGMPRSGSTLVEQILASHPQVEGTRELTEMLEIASHLAGTEYAFDSPTWPWALGNLDNAALRALGGEYLERTRQYRSSGRPLFTDKMPNNWLHVALIHLALPRARIIDVRRHPMACGWSNFRQHFTYGQFFTYDLGEMGACYREYVRLMAHYDAVLPGRIHRVNYEKLVTEPEAQVRALLDYCGLPFDERCLRPHETQRAIATPSAAQVQQPIYDNELEAWRAYEQWLKPLRDALGDVATAYPAVPAGW
jgi:tetratricopeptide (TPR) repeat protein